MRVLAVRRLAVLVLVGSLFFGLMPASSASAATSLAIRSALETKINATRTYYGLRPLRLTTFLMKCDAPVAAGSCMQVWTGRHARWMGQGGGLTHDSSTRLWAEVPSRAFWRAENIAYMSNRPAVAHYIHKAFMRSPGHRANILRPRATHMAVGVYQYRGNVWVAERFADLYP